MARSKQPHDQQPRAITPALPLEPGGLFRGGMWVELQKFGDHERDSLARQLLLSEIEEESDLPVVEASGLDLTVSEDRALHALQLLLDRTDYRGNIPGQEVHSSGYKWHGILPRLSITYTEYFEAYGLQKAGDQYQGKEREQALQALDGLTKRREIYYKRTKWTGEGKSRKALFDVIVEKKPLISILEGYKDLSEEEAARVLSGQDIPNRVTRLVIEFSPLLVDQIEDFYLLKSPALHEEVYGILGARRISQAVFLFLEWLLTWDRPRVRISKEKLAEKLRLSKDIKQRHMDRVEARFQDAFRAAKELGYLLDYREDAFGLLIFDLNPERCKRIKTGSARQEEAE